MARGLLRVWATMIAVVVGAASCSLAFDLSRQQCTSSDDCTSPGFSSCEDNVCVGTGDGGGVADPAFACLDGFVTPEPAAGETVAHNIRFELATAAGVPPAGLVVQVCDSLDVDCITPIQSPQPDANGALILELAPTFNGFLEVTSDETIPALAYLQSPVLLPPKENVFRLIGLAQFQGLVTAAQQTYDDTRGVAVILTDNCLDERSSGITLATENTDGQTVSFYFNGSLPDSEATATDEQGAGGYLNLPLGIVSVTSARLSDGQFIGRASFRSRAGTLSYVAVGPTPE